MTSIFIKFLYSSGSSLSTFIHQRDVSWEHLFDLGRQVGDDGHLAGALDFVLPPGNHLVVARRRHLREPQRVLHHAVGRQPRGVLLRAERCLTLANEATGGWPSWVPAASHHCQMSPWEVPPSLGVLRRRFLEDSEKKCDRDIDATALAGVPASMFENYRGTTPEMITDMATVTANCW